MSTDNYKTIRDPLHGDIFLPTELVSLLDTREMQRLRGIKQLGTASLVFPGAVHTRFEHSIGTCSMAARMLDVLGEHGHAVSPEDKLAILAAALVHDVGHIPFGHTIEDERRLFPRHDTPERLRQALCHGELGRALRSLNLTKQVLDILNKKCEHAWWWEIISGTICADLLDYLARDAFFCGLPGRYDERILRTISVEDDHLYISAERDGIIRDDVVSEVLNVLRLRYFLTERVFFHHTKTATGAMISCAVEHAIANGLKQKDLFPLTDERLLAMLEYKYAPMDAVVRKLSDCLASRRVYKRAYVLTRRIGAEQKLRLVERFHEHIEARAEAERILTKSCRLREGDIIVYCPAANMQLKEANVRLKTSDDMPRPLSSLEVPEVAVMRENYQNLWRFYIFLHPQQADKITAVSHACEEYFGLANHLPALQSPQLYMGI